MGTKQHSLEDGRGIQLADVITGAKRHDVTQGSTVLDFLGIEPPEAVPEKPQHWCAEKAFDNQGTRDQVQARGSIAHIQSGGDERREKALIPGYRARRQVVGSAPSRMNRFRKMLIRFEKTGKAYLALVHFPCAIIAWHRVYTFMDKSFASAALWSRTGRHASSLLLFHPL